MSLRFDPERRRNDGAADRHQQARQQVGYAQAFADSDPARHWTDVTGQPLDCRDILAALRDTGLCLAIDSEGIADGTKWAAQAHLISLPDDPLDVDTAEDGIESHFDVEGFDREQAAMRRRGEADRRERPGGDE